MKQIKVVIFDFGGVICQASDESGRYKWEKILNLQKGELKNIVFHSEIAKRSIIGKATEADVWLAVKEKFGLNKEEIIEIRHDFWSGHTINHDLTEFVTQLRTNYKTAILSNFWHGAREKFRHTFGFENSCFDMIIISSEEGIAKPDKSIYALIADRLNISFEEMIFIDDEIENVQYASLLGIHSVLFQNNSQTILDIEKILNK